MNSTNLVALSTLFNVRHGTKLDYRQMEATEFSDPDGVRFVSRISDNLGVVGNVKKYRDIEPLTPGSITVALGGTYLLSAFVQERPFYTAQNVAVLTPKKPMSLQAKLFYCICLGRNRFRYSAFGREANRTLGSLLVPAEVPAEFEGIPLDGGAIPAAAVLQRDLPLNVAGWRPFKLTALFEVGGTAITPLVKLREYGPGPYPHVTEQATNNGVSGFFDHYTEKGGVLTVESAVAGYCSYQPLNFSAGDHVVKLMPKFPMNQYVALFLTAVLNLEHHRFSYGRKAGQSRLRQMMVRLPSDGANPDWEFAETFIKTLPHSAALPA